MLSEIGTVNNIPEFIEGVKNRYLPFCAHKLNFYLVVLFLYCERTGRHHFVPMDLSYFPRIFIFVFLT